MRFSPRSRLYLVGSVNYEPLIILAFCFVYLAVMMTFASDVRLRFGIHPAITVAAPLAVCYGLGWMVLRAGNRFRGKRAATVSYQASTLKAGAMILAVLLGLAGLAVLTVEGIVALVRIWA